MENIIKVGLAAITKKFGALEKFLHSEDALIALVVLLVLLLILTPYVWVMVSNRSHGGAKFGWLLAIFFFSWLGLAAFLILTQPSKEVRS